MDSTEPLSRRAPGRRNLRIATGATAALFLVVVACGDSGGSAGPPPVLPTTCTPVESKAILEATHIPNGQKATYNSTPPTSGQHYAQPAGVGGYSQPIPNETQVHNLEHGHVMVQHNGLEPAQIEQLADVVKSDPRMVLMAPYPDMDARIALTSWGKIQTCSAWSDTIPDVVRYFVKTNRDNAPESIP